MNDKIKRLSRQSYQSIIEHMASQYYHEGFYQLDDEQRTAINSKMIKRASIYGFELSTNGTYQSETDPVIDWLASLIDSSSKNIKYNLSNQKISAEDANFQFCTQMLVELFDCHWINVNTPIGSFWLNGAGDVYSDKHKKVIEPEDTMFRYICSYEYYGKAPDELNIDISGMDESKLLDEYSETRRYPVFKIGKGKHGEEISFNLTGTWFYNLDFHEQCEVYNPSDLTKNYRLISIKSNRYQYGNKYPQPIHQIIAYACSPPKTVGEKVEVNHIDGNKAHNFYKNLEVVTISENRKHAVRTGLNPSIGEDNPAAKYTENDVRRVCQLLCDHPDWPYAKIAKETGVSKALVVHLSEKDRWNHVTEDYVFPSRIGNRVLRGEGNNNSKYTTEQVETVCKLLDDNASGKSRLSNLQIAKMCNVSKQAVTKIKCGRSWKHVAEKHSFYKDTNQSSLN